MTYELSNTFKVIMLTGMLGAPAVAIAQSDPYHITDAEKAACTPDAERLCASSYPDEKKLLACMEANQASLSPSCSVVFSEGMKKRHLVAR